MYKALGFRCLNQAFGSASTFVPEDRNAAPQTATDHTLQLRDRGWQNAGMFADNLYWVHATIRRGFD